MNIYDKICSIMDWNIPDGSTAEEVFQLEAGDTSLLPSEDVVDCVLAGGLTRWSKQQDCESEAELVRMIERLSKNTINAECFKDKNKRSAFPLIFNFYCYIDKLSKNGRLTETIENCAADVWNTHLFQKRLAERCSRMFEAKPDKGKFKDASARMSEIWGFTPETLDMLRYFVCQCKERDFNPSLNKNLFFYGEKKQTGKTTLARAFCCVLNGDRWENFGIYSSTFAKEIGFSDHDLPMACLVNAVLLDEAMPKDSRKSYGAVKSMLTGNSYNYNPKYRQVVTVPAKRNYIMTSNDDIVDFIQDKFERRFLAVHFTRKPKQLSFDEIYNLVKSFCQNAEPDGNWQRWYDSFDYVSGLAEKEKEEAFNEILSQAGTLFVGSAVTVKQVANRLYKNEPTREQKRIVEDIFREHFAECCYAGNKYMFSVSMLVKAIGDIKQGVDITEDELTGLPF